MDQTAKNTRFLALDGLRGLAALVVLVHHIILVAPQVDALRSIGPDLEGSPAFWLVAYTPLHLLWAGSEAVYVFFVLSGFVLALPFLRTKKPQWRSYYPKRLVRLYLPVWGSIAIGVAAVWVVPRLPHENASEWIALHTEPFNVLQDIVLLGGTDNLNSPLWSLQWEVLFSLFLPAYLWLGQSIKTHWVSVCVVLVLVIGLGSAIHSAPLILMPMFGIGVLMAIQQDVLRTWACKLGRVSWIVILVLGSILLTSNWVLVGVPGSTAMAATGAATIVFAFLFFSPAIRLGTFRPVQWAGSRSFSLYLVHEPIIVSVAFATESRHPMLIAVVAIPVSLAAAELFFRVVERPSHVIAQRIGQRMERPHVADRVRDTAAEAARRTD